MVMGRQWIKLHTAENLRGTIRFDFTIDERSVWYDLLLMAGDNQLDGYISPGAKGYPINWIASTLNIPEDLLRRTITKCTTFKMIEQTALGLHITEWNKYQSEYDRQKKYRTKKQGEAP